MNIAVLIDAENVLPAFAEQIFEHAASLGTVVRREIYGAAQSLNTWVEPVLKYAIHSNLTIRPTKYKNSSDIALVIGAMDMIGEADAMVIASSDSDFSSLAVRLRSAGTEVIGMGTEKANPL
ncbi:MAG: NYN domain-containing protein, partial [Clostridia bacterium]|nr:NYN domain-containing protein [Clostridia bacterium]